MLELTGDIDSKFRFILIAAKRARQLQGGAKPMIHTTSKKPTRIAQEEVRSGVVKFELLPYAKHEEPAEETDSKKLKVVASTNNKERKEE